LWGKGVEEVCPSPGRAVQVRGKVEGVAVQADSVPPLLVGEEDDDVRTIPLRVRMVSSLEVSSYRFQSAV